MARRIGLGLALLFRLVLLGSIAALVRFTTPLFAAFSHEFSLRDLILLAGASFSCGKRHARSDSVDPRATGHRGQSLATPGVASAIGQIILLDASFRSTASSLLWV